MKLEMQIALEPLPQPRPKIGRGRAYEPARIAMYKTAVAEAGRVAMAGEPLIAGAVEISMRLGRKFNPSSRRFGDVDNLAKALLDGLTGTIWQDDSQVVKLSVEKFQTQEPLIELQITELNPSSTDEARQH